MPIFCLGGRVSDLTATLGGGEKEVLRFSFFKKTRRRDRVLGHRRGKREGPRPGEKRKGRAIRCGKGPPLQWWMVNERKVHFISGREKGKAFSYVHAFLRREGEKGGKRSSIGGEGEREGAAFLFTGKPGGV